MKYANYKKGSWKDVVGNHLRSAKRAIQNPENEENEYKLDYDLKIVKNALEEESKFLDFPFDGSNLDREHFTMDVYNETYSLLEKIGKHYNKIYNQNNRKKDNIIISYEEQMGKDKFIQFKDDYSNDNLNTFLTNSNTTTFIQEFEGRLIPKKDYIYIKPYTSTFLNSHFYSPYKRLFGRWVPTLWANTLIIWILTLIFGITLFSNFFNRMGKWIGQKIGKVIPD